MQHKYSSEAKTVSETDIDMSGVPQTSNKIGSPVEAGVPDDATIAQLSHSLRNLAQQALKRYGDSSGPALLPRKKQRMGTPEPVSSQSEEASSSPLLSVQSTGSTDNDDEDDEAPNNGENEGDVNEGNENEEEDDAPLTSKQHEQLEGLFGAGYLRDHHLVDASLRPFLPDDAVEAEHSNSCDPRRMSVHGVSDEKLKRISSRLHVKNLFQASALHNGDHLHFTASSSSGVPMERSVTILETNGIYRKGYAGRIGLRVEIDNPRGPHDPLTDLHSGMGTLVEEVTQHFRDRKGPQHGDLYRGVWVVRDGVKLGDIYDVRLRFALWDAIIQLWATRTGQNGVRRKNQRNGPHCR
ncbi:MAG: hypothetical protein Q9218_005478 [Villophora microphyllina]